MEFIKAVCVLYIFLNNCEGAIMRNTGGKNMKMTVDSHPMLASVFSVANNVKMIEIQQGLKKDNSRTNGAGIEAKTGTKHSVNSERKKFELFPDAKQGGIRPLELNEKPKGSINDGQATIIGDTTNAICRYCRQIQNLTCIQIYCFNTIAIANPFEQPMAVRNTMNNGAKPAELTLTDRTKPHFNGISIEGPTFPGELSGTGRGFVPVDKPPLLPAQRLKPVPDMHQAFGELPTNGMRHSGPANNGPMVQHSQHSRDKGAGFPMIPLDALTPDNLSAGGIPSQPMINIERVRPELIPREPIPSIGIMDNNPIANVHQLHTVDHIGQVNPVLPHDGPIPDRVPIKNGGFIPVNVAEPVSVNPSLNDPGNSRHNAISFDNEFRQPNVPASSNIDMVPSQPIDGNMPFVPFDNTMQHGHPQLGTNSQTDPITKIHHQGSLDMVRQEAMEPTQGVHGATGVHGVHGHGQITSGTSIQAQSPDILVNVAGARPFDAMNPLSSEGRSEPQLPDNIGQVSRGEAVVSSAQGFLDLKPHLGESGAQGLDLSNGQINHQSITNSGSGLQPTHHVDQMPSNTIARVPSAQNFHDLKPHLTRLEHAEMANNQLLNLLSGNGNDLGPVQNGGQQVGTGQSGLVIPSAQGFQELKPHSRLSGVRGAVNTASDGPAQHSAPTGMGSVRGTHNGFVDELGQPINTFAALNKKINEIQVAEQAIDQGVLQQHGAQGGFFPASAQEMVPNAIVQTTTAVPTTVTIATLSPRRRAELDAFFSSMKVSSRRNQ